MKRFSKNNLVSRLLTFSFRLSTLAVLVTSATSAAAAEFQVTGFLKASAIGSSRSTQSFGQENYSAPTASRPEYTLANGSPSNDDGGLSLQMAQSRVGFAVIADENTKGVFEFDFVDFARSSPTTQMYPRVRIAKIEYRLTPNAVLQAGQDWDVYSPLNTFSYNYVGNAFQAGNAGFMRQQLIYIHTDDGFEQKAALGLFSANVNPQLTDVERSSVPTLAYSVSSGTAPHRIGASLLYSRYIVRPSSGRKMTDLYGLNLFADQKIGSVDLRAEAYYGQNLATSGALSLANTSLSAGRDLREAGGWISARTPITPNSNVFATLGYASILNAENLSSPALTSATNATGVGIPINNIAANFVGKIGVDRKLTEKLSIFAEVSQFQTRFKTIGDGQSTLIESGLFLFL